jgi:hypothetical protein
MSDDAVQALRVAADLPGFVAACRRLSGVGAAACYRPDGLSRLVPLVSQAVAIGWDWYVRDPQGPLGDRWFDFVFNAALLSGMDNRLHSQYTGMTALEATAAWTASLHAMGLLPLRDPSGLSPSWRAAVDGTLDGFADAPRRRAVLEELLAPCASAKLALAIARLQVDDGGRLSGKLGLNDARLLGLLFPTAFGGDPFAARACLALIMLADHLSACGHAVEADIPAPVMDGLPWYSVLSTGSDAPVHVKDADCWAGDHQGVRDSSLDRLASLRAATIVACNDLAEIAGLPVLTVVTALVRQDVSRVLLKRELPRQGD